MSGISKKPAIPSQRPEGINDDLWRYLQSIKEIIESYEGSRGSVYDQILTKQDAVNAGIELRSFNKPSGIRLNQAQIGGQFNHSKIDGDGNLIFKGTAGLAFGHMTNDTGDTIAIAAGGTWYEVTSGFVTGNVHLVTFGGDHYLSVMNSGKYLVNVSASLEGATAGDNIGVTVAVNGTAQTAGHAHSTIGNTTDQVGMASSFIVDLTEGDEVSVAVTNHTAARNLDIIHSSLTIVQIGG